MNTFYIAPQEPKPQTPAARRASQKRAAADRSRRYREKAAEEGLPVTREVDQALAESLSFVSRRAVIVGGRPLIDLGDVVTIAGLILKRGGKKKSGSLAVVRDRIGHRVEHTGPNWMPSTCPLPANQLLPPEGGRTWSENDVEAVQAALDRHKVKSSPPSCELSHDEMDFIDELIAGLRFDADSDK